MKSGAAAVFGGGPGCDLADRLTGRSMRARQDIQSSLAFSLSQASLILTGAKK